MQIDREDPFIGPCISVGWRRVDAFYEMHCLDRLVRAEDVSSGRRPFMMNITLPEA